MNPRSIRSRFPGAEPLRRQTGMTLIELMVSLVIGLFLMVGAFTVYLHTRTSFALNQTLARLQENGRFALDAIEPDIRMARYWGLTKSTHTIAGQATPSEPLSSLAAAGDCGNNWSVDLSADLDGTNDSFSWACSAYGSGAQANTDTLVVRRAAQPIATTIDANTLYVQSGRFGSGQLFTGVTTAPSGHPASEVHALVVDGYYVSQSSTLGTNIPSLRVKHLIGISGSGPSIRDDEVMPGVEDMQVQFGVDDDAASSPGRGTVDRYVNPGAAMLDPTNAAYNADARILAVRIWLRIRAINQETGFKDDRTYTYAGHTIAAPNDAFRRIVVSKTIFVRNALPVS